MNQELTARQLQLLDILKSWATVQEVIAELEDEEELRWLMQAERNGTNRLRLLNRLYSRYSVVRKNREIRELSEGKLPF